MKISEITNEFSISPQISVADIAIVASQGFKTIICNRPDGEEFGQPTFAEIEAACSSAGIECSYLPITQSGIQPDALPAIRDAFTTLPKPILGYCRSGARSNMAWQASAT